MARTIEDIQAEILNEKERVNDLNALNVLTTNEKQTLQNLNNSSKAAIWRLWVYIVSTAIWLHEKVVERNALISRPHTLAWYREQALNYVQGAELVWQDGYFQFNLSNIQDIEAAKKVRFCAISERLFSDVFNNLNEDDQNTAPQNQDVASLIQEYYYNQVGIITMKVAGLQGGRPQALLGPERIAFENYMNQIKDAGTQIRVVSTTGDKIRIELEVYVNPLVIYIEGENQGKLIRDLSRSPVEEVILEYIQNLEFNGAFVPTFLIDKIQNVEGVQLPILRRINIAPYYGSITDDNYTIYNDGDNKQESPFFVPNSGYFNTDFGTDEGIVIKYFAYNLQTDPSFNVQIN